MAAIYTDLERVIIIGQQSWDDVAAAAPQVSQEELAEDGQP